MAEERERILHRGKRGPRITPRWEPVEWKEHYNQIVMLSVNGISNIAIGNTYSITPQQVSNIINSERGKVVARELGNKRLEVAQADIQGRLERLSLNALDVVEKIYSRKGEDLIQESPLSFLDRSMAILKSTGKIKDDKAKGSEGNSVTVNHNNITVNQQTNNVTVPINIAARVNSGLDKLSMIDEIHGKLNSVDSK